MLIIKRFVNDVEAATAVEYGLMLACLALAILGAVTLLGTRLTSTFTRVGNLFG